MRWNICTLISFDTKAGGVTEIFAPWLKTCGCNYCEEHKQKEYRHEQSRNMWRTAGFIPNPQAMNHLNVMFASRWKWLKFVPTVKYATLILLSCAEAAVQSEPFCFHAGTTLKCIHIISHFYVYTTVWMTFSPGSYFLTELLLMTHRLMWRINIILLTKQKYLFLNVKKIIFLCWNKHFVFLRLYWAVKSCESVVVFNTLNKDIGQRTKGKSDDLHQHVKQNRSHKGESLLSNQAQWRKL